MMPPFVIENLRLGLSKLTPAFSSRDYLAWLNDPQVQMYTRRRGGAVSEKEMREFIDESASSGDWHLAIVLKDTAQHVGNISLNSIDRLNNSAELSIMIGDRSVWGKGVGEEAIRLATQFAFDTLELMRLWAESPNPAFNAIMRKLGWRKEGERRSAFLIGATYLDLECWSLLKSDWSNGKARNITTALLMTDGSPVGLRYLESMIEEHLEPRLVIISRTPKLSQMAIKTVNERTGGKFHWRPLDELLVTRNIPVYFVDNHSSDYSADLLVDHGVNVAVLGGCGIIKENIISLPGLQVVNVHPGILPKYRGCSAVEWSIYNNDEVGATCHLVTAEIDAGEIITISKVQISRGDTYADVRLKVYNLLSEVLIVGLKILMRLDYRDHLKPNDGTTYFKPIPADEMREVEERLAANTYHHYIS